MENNGNQCDRVQHRNPWTSEPIKVIQFANGHLFAAEGCRVVIWNEISDNVIAMVKVFPEDSPIVAISCDVLAENRTRRVQILVCSLYLYRTAAFDLESQTVKLDELQEAPFGEILAGRSFQNSGDFLIYDAINTAVVNTNGLVSIFKGELAAPDCVTVFGNSVDQVLIFVATASKVNICKLEWENQRIGVITSFMQNKGVIFSVNFYPKHNLILTTSDERAIFLWKYELNNLQDTSRSPISSILQFGISVSLQVTLEGHTSRVYNSIVVDNHIVSCGEDSTVVSWNLHNPDQHYILGSHGGSTVWSCCHSPNSRVYSCGDDGSIFRWNLPKIPEIEQFKEHELIQPWISALDTKDFPRQIKSLNLENCAVTTNTGKLFFMNKDNILSCSQNNNWKSYLTFAFSMQGKFCVTATIHGSILLHKLTSGSYNLETLFELQLPLREKVLFIIIVEEEDLVVASVLALIRYKISQSFDKTELVHVWTTKQKSNTNCVYKLNNSIFVGLDNGKIKSYNWNTGMKLNEFAIHHNRFGVGGISEYNGLLITGGRDAKLNLYFIDRQIMEESPYTSREGISPDVITHLRSVPLPFLWVGRLVKYKDDLLICGFDSADFVVFSFKREQVIARAHCGGAHRSWDFYVEGGVGVFCHIRCRKVFTIPLDIESYLFNCLKAGFHLDTINSAVDIPTTNPHTIMIATASEDCSVKVCRLRVSHTNILKDGMTTVCIQSSAVRCLTYERIKANCEGYLLSGGGRSELFLTKLFFRDDRLEKYQNIRRFCFEENIDFRVMDIKSVIGTEHLERNSSSGMVKYFGFVACSDSILRIIQEVGSYKLSRNYLKATGNGTCLTSVATGQVNSSCASIISGTTGGDIIIWQAQFAKFVDLQCQNFPGESIPPLRILSFNIMPITSMAVQCISENLLQIFIGRHDGSIDGVMYSEAIPENEINSTKITSDGILGLQMKDRSHSQLYFVSGGSLFHSDDTGNLLSVPIPVQDCQGLIISQHFLENIFTVYGKGISVFSLPFNEEG